MIFKRPWLVLWLLDKGGWLERIKASPHRFGHAVWINGLNFLLTFGPTFLLLRLWLGPDDGWGRSFWVVVAGALVYGLMVASAAPKR